MHRCSRLPLSRERGEKEEGGEEEEEGDLDHLDLGLEAVAELGDDLRHEVLVIQALPHLHYAHDRRLEIRTMLVFGHLYGTERINEHYLRFVVTKSE